MAQPKADPKNSYAHLNGADAQRLRRDRRRVKRSNDTQPDSPAVTRLRERMGGIKA